MLISDDIEKLNELLAECGDDSQQQELINQLFKQLGDERDPLLAAALRYHKLNRYAPLITEMTARVEVRKAEAKRMRIESDLKACFISLYRTFLIRCPFL